MQVLVKPFSFFCLIITHKLNFKEVKLESKPNYNSYLLTKLTIVNL